MRRQRQKSVIARPIPMGSARWGFPDRMVISHRYVEFGVSLVSTAGSLATYIFSANGMYDVNITSTGHQPMYFDEMAALYNHYSVYKSTAKFTFLPSAVQNAAVCAVNVDDDTNLHNNITYAFENGTSKTGYMSFNQNDPVIITAAWNSKQFGDNLLDNDNLQGSSAANPTEQSYYGVYHVALASQSSTVNLVAEITYYAIWDERKTNAGS